MGDPWVGLGLDLSKTRSGAAWVNSVGNDLPRCSSYGAPGSIKGDGGGFDYGPCLAGVRTWLTDLVVMVRPKRATYETPLIIPGRSPATMRMLICICGIAELVFHDAGIPLYERSVQTVRLHFCGSGRADKTDVQAQCRRLGWKFGNDDEADALAVLHYQMATADRSWQPPFALAPGDSADRTRIGRRT